MFLIPLRARHTARSASRRTLSTRTSGSIVVATALTLTGFDLHLQDAELSVDRPDLPQNARDIASGGKIEQVPGCSRSPE
jgi:hypothetical protein